MLFKYRTQYVSKFGKLSHKWPQYWKRSVFIPIPKQGNGKECSNYRTIVLISRASKVMLKILQATFLRVPPGSSVHGISQARILEWVAMPSSRGPAQPRDQTHICTSPALAGRFFTASAPWEAPEGAGKNNNHKICSPVHGILQARVLELGAIAFSK